MNIESVIMFLVQFIEIFAQIFSFAVLVRVVLSWFPGQRTWIHEFTGSAVDPALNMIKKIVPPLGFIDLSPIVLFLLIEFVSQLLIGFLLYIKDLLV
jgi:YggT family protein